MASPYVSDTETSGDSFDVTGHITGNPISGGTGAGATFTVGHTWLIIIGALAMLWLLGAGMFRSIRMP